MQMYDSKWQGPRSAMKKSSSKTLELFIKFDSSLLFYFLMQSDVETNELVIRITIVITVAKKLIEKNT